MKQPETIKLLGGSTKSKSNKDKNSENVPHLEIIIIINNNYQQDLRFLFAFVPNRWFGKLFDISTKNFIFLKTFDSEFLYIEVWFTDQQSKLLEIEDKINIALVIKLSVKYKK